MKNLKEIESLILEYKKRPEFFYIGSPIGGHVYQNSQYGVISICRLKRIKRISEKASRYAAEIVFNNHYTGDMWYQTMFLEFGYDGFPLGIVAIAKGSSLTEMILYQETPFSITSQETLKEYGEDMSLCKTRKEH